MVFNKTFEDKKGILRNHNLKRGHTIQGQKVKVWSQKHYTYDYKPEINLCDPEGKAVPARLVAPVGLSFSKITCSLLQEAATQFYRNKM